MKTFFKKHLGVVTILLLHIVVAQAQADDHRNIDDLVTYKVQNQLPDSWLYWSVEGGEILTDNPSQSDSIQVHWQVPGLQHLEVYEKTELDCLGLHSSIVVEVIDEAPSVQLQVGNLFTPNNDNRNDLFIIGYTQEPTHYKIVITDRWGDIVFESHNIHDSWDGRHHQRNCAPGVYYYIIEYQDEDQTKTKKGFVHLNR